VLVSGMERSSCPLCGTPRNEIVIWERGSVKQQSVWCPNPSCTAYGTVGVNSDELADVGQPA